MKALYTWGANSHGQLALDNLIDVTEPRRTTLPFTPELIVGGGRHTILSLEGEKGCCVCGCNDHQQLGVAFADVEVQLPSVVELPRTVKRAAAGWDFSLAVLDDGSLYGWGVNSHGQLGIENSQTAKEPTAVRGVENVQDVAAGLRHSVAVTQGGNVLTSGCNKRGQLGCSAPSSDANTGTIRRDTFGTVYLPVGTGRVVSAVAGSHHSALLTEQGQVVVWGCNRHGQLAHNPASCRQVIAPTLLDQRLFDDERVVQLASGWTHMLALTGSGRLLSWGRSDYGQLGRPCGDTCPQWTPAPVLLPAAEVTGAAGVHSIACGSEHNLALTEGGDVYSWGWNEHGMCGQGHEVNVLHPTRVAGLSNVKLVACGSGHSLALTR